MARTGTQRSRLSTTPRPQRSRRRRNRGGNSDGGSGWGSLCSLCLLAPDQGQQAKPRWEEDKRPRKSRWREMRRYFICSQCRGLRERMRSETCTGSNTDANVYRHQSTQSTQQPSPRVQGVQSGPASRHVLSLPSRGQHCISDTLGPAESSTHNGKARDGPSQSLDVPLVPRVPRPMPDGYG